ncbi:YihY/virulence factor BrkB family protein [Humibacter sp. RRB41]|uniref:YihY/virulence factor BrkB family protein n=1 Tax=Humibacter sp. RRB41 TaxID=2919946 RepID=UPI001FA974B2|nr:YihY/virulence factor BrkB family protein [Humibacter sp. RRB41]
MARRNAKSTDAPPEVRADDAATGEQASVIGAQEQHRVELLKAEAAREREQLTERIEEIADPLRDRLRGPVSRVNGWWQWVKALKPYRVWIQFSYNDGNLRTAGMSYQSLFAIFAALWVGFSVAGIWLTSNPSLMNALVDIINDAVPGLIQTSTQDGVISLDALDSLSTTFGWTSAIALVGLLWTTVAWLYYTRQAVRAMFDLDRDTRNYVLQKITDFGLAIVFGIVLIVSATVSVVTTEALTSFLGLFGISSGSFWSDFLYRVIGFTVSIALNFFTLAAMYRVLSRVLIPWRSLVVGPLLGAVALSALSVVSSLIIGGVGKNPLLATFAVFVGLLLWFNFICRIILLAAAWIAVGMFDRGLEPRRLTPEQLAYERAVAERQARLLLAQTQLQQEEAKAAALRGLSKWFANRRVRDAREALHKIENEPAPRPPRKRSWWADSGPYDPGTGAQAPVGRRRRGSVGGAD